MAQVGADVDVRIDGHRMLFAYSTDDDGRYVNDHRNRRFYLRPHGNDIYFDYAKGFNDYTDWSDTVIGDSSPNCRWMQDHRQVLIDSDILDTKQSRLNVDFVSGRMILTDLLQSGANRATRYSGVDVELYRGTYYIGGIREDIDQGAEENRDIDHQMKGASSQLLFQFLTSKDGRTPDEPAPMNVNAAFYSMIKVNCGKHRMLVSAELQAERRVNADEPPPVRPNPRNYLNVRSRERNRIVPPMKALQWWASNTIAGIPEIVCGLRDDERRIIHGIEYIKTDRLASENYTKESWEPGACIRTMESLLSQIKELVQGDDPNTVYHDVLMLEPVDYGPRLKERLQNRRFRLEVVDNDEDDDDDDDDIEEKTLHDILKPILEGSND